MISSNEKVFSEVSDIYVEKLGNELLVEYRELKRDNIEYITPNLERRIRNITGESKRNRSKILSVVAACIIFAMLIPGILGVVKNFGIKNSSKSDEAYAPAPEQKADDTSSESPKSEVGKAFPDFTGSDSGVELLALNFSSSESFTIYNSEVDNGKSIYNIKNRDQDDVVATLEYRSRDNWYESLRSVDINGIAGYISNKADYKMLIVPHEDILYTFTCRYDMATVCEFATLIHEF